MSRKKVINDLNELSNGSLKPLQESFESFLKTQKAIRTNYNEFPRASAFDLQNAKGDLENLNKINQTLREGNARVDEKFKHAHGDDDSLNKAYEQSLKEHTKYVNNVPDAPKHLAPAIVLLTLGLILVAAYILCTIVKKDLIPIEIPFLAWIAVLGVGAILAVIGAILMVLFSLGSFNANADFKELHEKLEARSGGDNELRARLAERTTQMDQALKAMIIVEGEVLSTIKGMPDGDAFFHMAKFIGGATTLIFEKRAATVPEALNIISNEIQLREIKELLLENQLVSNNIIKEIRISNRISIAAFSGTDLELGDKKEEAKEDEDEEEEEKKEEAPKAAAPAAQPAPQAAPAAPKPAPAAQPAPQAAPAAPKPAPAAQPAPQAAPAAPKPAPAPAAQPAPEKKEE